jgi:hypothetical protein
VSEVWARLAGDVVTVEPGKRSRTGDREWTSAADTFPEDWDLVEASAEERGRLREVGFRV